MTEESDEKKIGALLELVVHDLKSPVTGLRANLGFVSAVAGQAEEVVEAIEDSEAALDQLLRGLEHLRWIGRALGDRPAIAPSLGDLRDAVRRGVAASGVEGVAIELPAEPVERRLGGAPIETLVKLLVQSAGRHGRNVRVRMRDGDEIEVIDDGKAIPPELRSRAFTADGQTEIKSHPQGRYELAAGLYAMGLLAVAAGGVLEAAGTDGAALYRIRFLGDTD
ncbi:MAG: sensor histidine kinase [Myxococcales bacterium]|nr:sensor histidine kinase [Myxococcales bacterium]